MEQPKHDEMRVADYVLGVMEPREFARFEREMHDNPALAVLVTEWRERVAAFGNLPVGGSLATSPEEKMRERVAAAALRHASPEAEEPTRTRRSRRNIGPMVMLGLFCFACGVSVGAVLVWLEISQASVPPFD